MIYSQNPRRRPKRQLWPSRGRLICAVLVIRQSRFWRNRRWQPASSGLYWLVLAPHRHPHRYRDPAFESFLWRTDFNCARKCLPLFDQGPLNERYSDEIVGQPASTIFARADIGTQPTGQQCDVDFATILRCNRFERHLPIVAVCRIDCEYASIPGRSRNVLGALPVRPFRALRTNSGV